jgi:hypothetical protein
MGTHKSAAKRKPQTADKKNNRWKEGERKKSLHSYSYNKTIVRNNGGK